MTCEKNIPELLKSLCIAKIIKLTLFTCFKSEYLSFATKVRHLGTIFEQNKVGFLPSKYER
jgi:hypothetical protein